MVASATCVSAIFGVKVLKVLFHALHDDVFRFSIGGLVLEKFDFSESPESRVFPRWRKQSWGDEISTTDVLK